MKNKNRIAAIVSFIVLSTIMWGCTYLYDMVEQEGRKLIIIFWCVFSGIGSYIVPMYIIIDKIICKDGRN